MDWVVRLQRRRERRKHLDLAGMIVNSSVLGDAWVSYLATVTQLALTGVLFIRCLMARWWKHISYCELILHIYEVLWIMNRLKMEVKGGRGLTVITPCAPALNPTIHIAMQANDVHSTQVGNSSHTFSIPDVHKAAQKSTTQYTETWGQDKAQHGLVSIYHFLNDHECCTLLACCTFPRHVAERVKFIVMLRASINAFNSQSVFVFLRIWILSASLRCHSAALTSM